MSVFKVTIKNSGNTNGVRYEKGLSVQILSKDKTTQNPFSSLADKKSIADAFMRMYNLDVNKACLVNTIHMDFEKL